MFNPRSNKIVPRATSIRWLLGHNGQPLSVPFNLKRQLALHPGRVFHAGGQKPLLDH